MQSAPGAWIPYAKQSTIRMEIVRLCDNLDGLADGVINNYVGCNRKLDPKINPDPLKNIRCAGGADTGNDCLSDAQMTVINAFHSPIDLGFPLADGLTTIPPVETSQEDPAGMGLGTRWQEILEKQPDPNSIPMALLIQRYGHPEKYDLGKHDIAEFKDDILAISKIMDPPDDWSQLMSGRTKVILHSAAADYATYSTFQQRLYEQIVKHSGQATVDEHMRFYVTPNANHGIVGFSATTGVALPRYMDLIGTLQNWVENGVTPPNALRQTDEEQTPPYTVLRSRPLCRYPNYPRYTGKGDPQKLESYTCAAP